ncbi:MAG: TerC family protein [Chloroflexi bacterium]|nr:TerC family protein [Chloroflexota bacterium]
MAWINDPQSWIALITLTALEIVLGIDNIIFISILSNKLPTHQQARGRHVGLLMAMGTRILLLLSLAWMIHLTQPLFSIFGKHFSGRDLILIGGGLFLLAKSTYEIHEKLEGEEGHAAARAPVSFAGVIIQIALLDVVFSLDSVITAVGMVEHVSIMIIAVILAVSVMMLSVDAISLFVEQHPTIKVLALSFLLLIGVSLIAEGFDFYIPKGYIYFAMAFSIFVEFLNIRLRKTTPEPIKLRSGYSEPKQTSPSEPALKIG